MWKYIYHAAAQKFNFPLKKKQINYDDQISAMQ